VKGVCDGVPVVESDTDGVCVGVRVVESDAAALADGDEETLADSPSDGDSVADDASDGAGVPDGGGVSVLTIVTENVQTGGSVAGGDWLCEPETEPLTDAEPHADRDADGDAEPRGDKEPLGDELDDRAGVVVRVMVLRADSDTDSLPERVARATEADAFNEADEAAVGETGGVAVAAKDATAAPDADVEEVALGEAESDRVRVPRADAEVEPVALPDGVFERFDDCDGVLV